jgi:hypothetical protein
MGTDKLLSLGILLPCVRLIFTSCLFVLNIPYLLVVHLLSKSTILGKLIISISFPYHPTDVHLNKKNLNFAVLDVV